MEGVNTTGYVTPESDLISNKTKTREPKQDMDKDAFMQMLVTQLRYQDPLNPMDNQEMMAQLAQFTALEQMMNVATATNKQLAHSMIGDYVEYQYKDEAGRLQVKVGKIDYVKTTGSDILIGIGEHEVTMEDIKKVVDSGNIQADSSAFELIGQTVQAVVEGKADAEGKKENTIIEGEVLQVVMKDSKPYVVIGTGDKRVEISLENVKNVVEKPTITNKHITGTVTQKKKDPDGNLLEETETIEVSGKVQYIAMQKDNTYIYIYDEAKNNYYFVNFDDIKTVNNK